MAKNSKKKCDLCGDKAHTKIDINLVTSLVKSSTIKDKESESIYICESMSCKSKAEKATKEMVKSVMKGMK
jgi:hypothetical protein